MSSLIESVPTGIIAGRSSNGSVRSDWFKPTYGAVSVDKLDSCRRQQPRSPDFSLRALRFKNTYSWRRRSRRLD